MHEEENYDKSVLQFTEEISEVELPKDKLDVIIDLLEGIYSRLGDIISDGIGTYEAR